MMIAVPPISHVANCALPGTSTRGCIVTQIIVAHCNATYCPAMCALILTTWSVSGPRLDMSSASTSDGKFGSPVKRHRPIGTQSSYMEANQVASVSYGRLLSGTEVFRNVLFIPSIRK